MIVKIDITFKQLKAIKGVISWTIKKQYPID